MSCKKMKVGGLRRLLRTAVSGMICGASLLTHAQLAPPGILRSVDVTDTQALVMPLPLEATQPDTTQTFGTQADPTGLIVAQWDPSTQAWKTATLTPGTGWSGDVLQLTPAFPISLQLPAGQGSLRLSIGGLFPAADLTQTLHPGLNHVGSPTFSTKPLTSWTWTTQGLAGTTQAVSDELFDPANQVQAWLENDQGTITWTGVPDPAQSGELLSTGAYFYELKAAAAVQVTGTVEPGFNAATLPAVTSVSYDAAQDEVEVEIETAPGSSHTVDLYYLDLSFPGGYDANATWSVWKQGEVLGSGSSFSFTDTGEGDRPHPRTPDARLYQVGDATLDTDGDGLTDSFELLVSQSSPTLVDTDGDGMDDPLEVQLGLDPALVNAPPSSQDLLAEFSFDTDATDQEGNLTPVTIGSPQFLAAAGVVGGAMKLQEGSALHLPDHPDLNNAGPYRTRTLSLWFTVDHFGFGRQMIYESGGTVRGFNLYVENGVLYAGAWDLEKDSAAQDVQTWAGSWQTTTRIQENTWHHVVLRLDASADPRYVRTGVWQATLDGIPFEQGSTSGMQVYTHGDDAGLGQVTGSSLAHDGATSGWNSLYGALDQVQIWNRALHQDEISTLYGLGLAQGTQITWNVDSFYTLTGGLNGDPDGDGLSNAQEIGQGSDPDAFTTLPENATALTEQLWWNLTGNGVPYLLEDPDFPYSPDQQMVHDQLEDLFTTEEKIGNFYGRRMFGKFVAPLSGDYTFWLSSDDRSELWLDINGTRTRVATCTYTGYQHWTKFGSQKSAPVTLQAGQVIIVDALMKEHSGGDHLSVGVTLPDNRYERPIRAGRFLPVAPGTDFALDTDSDGLSDYEESVVGTDPQVADTSGDGLTDFEAVVFNKDPLVLHNPLPPIDAAWVLQYGIATDLPYIHEDFDGDHLSNYQEFLYGSNPWLADSSGDGWSDEIVALQFGLDPSQVWFDGTQNTVLTQNGSAATASQHWTATPQNTLQAEGRAGTVTYELTTAQPGTYGIQFTMSQYNSFGGQGTFRLHLRVNGISVGSRQVTLSSSTTTDVLFLSPELPVGTHSLDLRVENIQPGDFLEIHQLNLISLGGVDANTNGTADWMEARTQQALDATFPLTSPVSPVYLEGMTHGGAQVTVVSEVDPQTELTSSRGPRGLWYANVDLLETGATDVTLTETFTGATDTHAITWTQTNVLQPPVDPVQIRVGDALLLNAVPLNETEGTVTYLIEGQTFQQDVTQPFAYSFEQAGLVTVDATWSHNGQTQQATLDVDVVAAGFSTVPAIVMQQTLYWENPALSDEVVLDADPLFRYSELPLAGGGKELKVWLPNSEPQTIVARLGENGPVLDSKTVIGIESRIATSFTVVQTFADGSQLLQMELAISDVEENLEITLKLGSGGISFENGSNQITYTADDVGEDGVLRYTLLQSPTNYSRVCHYIYYSYSE